MERPTPYAKIQNLHDEIRQSDVQRGALDDEALLQVACQAPVQEQQTGFGAPLNCAHALLNQQDCLGAPCSVGFFGWCQVDRMRWVDQVRRDFQVNIEKDYQDCIQALEMLVFVR